MRTIIISDITSEGSSIIPYALNIGKHTETRVDILHYIDPQGEQGSYSPYGDSHTMSPGEKLSQNDVIDKQTNKAHTLLDRLLSKEASRLNYPLRINQIIEVKPLQEALEEIIKEHPEGMLITGVRPADTMAESLAELLIMLKDTDSLVMIVPPDQRFFNLTEGIMVTNFSEDNIRETKRIFKWLKPFETQIFACNLESTGDEKDIDRWKESVEESGSTYINATGALNSENPVRAVIDYVNENKPDIVILPKGNKAFAEYLFAGKHAQQFIEALGKPVILY